jgi:hypothetical protein
MFRVEWLASAPEQKAEKSCSTSRAKAFGLLLPLLPLFSGVHDPKKKNQASSDEGRLQNIFFQISYHTQNGGQYNFILFHAKGKAISRACSRRDERLRLDIASECLGKSFKSRKNPFFLSSSAFVSGAEKEERCVLVQRASRDEEISPEDSAEKHFVFILLILYKK